MRHPVLVVVITAVLASCAAETAVDPTTTSPPTTTTSPSTTATTTTTLPAATTTTEPELDVEIRDGEVTGPDRFEYRTGETVSITVVADTAYELHVHGYDLFYDLVPEAPLTIEFTADVPGIFEVETHPGHLLVFEIRVGA